MKPRILHIISAMNYSTAEKQLGLLLHGLPHDRFDIHVCALSGRKGHVGNNGTEHHGQAGAAMQSGGNSQPYCKSSDQLSFNNAPLTVISKRWKFDPKTFWELKQLVDRLKPNLVHSWMSTDNVYAMAAAKASGVTRFVAGYCHIDPFKSFPSIVIDRYIGKQSVQLMANSTGVRAFYIQKGLPTEKFQVIPNAVEPSRPSLTTRRQLLDELGLPEKSRLIGLVTSLTSRHRVKDAIWAADLLKVVRKDVHLLIIGDGPHRDEIRRFRDQVRISDFVHFLGWRNDLTRMMPHFDLLWSPSPFEDQSNAILEAMSAGVVVVAADAPCSRDLVVHQDTGFLVPIGDRGGFARHAHQIFEDSALVNRLSQAARARANKEFPPENMVARHVDMYQRLLG
jgi:glycosyltransferase involved in cell wall biosynthesis